MPNNSEKLPRLRNGREGDGSYVFSLALNKLRTRFLLAKVSKAPERFVAFIVRASADGFAVGGSFLFFTFSLAFKDEVYLATPSFTYGLFIGRLIALYLPNRYVLCRF